MSTYRTNRTNSRRQYLFFFKKMNNDDEGLLLLYKDDGEDLYDDVEDAAADENIDPAVGDKLARRL
jgi:hypothetical protein